VLHIGRVFKLTIQPLAQDCSPSIAKRANAES
jgi:hypothetical protein